MSKRALITGMTGRDGSYLSKLLLGSGREAHGLIRRARSFNTGRIDHLDEDRHPLKTQFHLLDADLTEGFRRGSLLSGLAHDQRYNLAAKIRVRVQHTKAGSLIGHPSITARVLGLRPQTLSPELARTMVNANAIIAERSETFMTTDLDR